jgi:hypothetical protein
MDLTTSIGWKMAENDLPKAWRDFRKYGAWEKAGKGRWRKT